MCCGKQKCQRNKEAGGRVRTVCWGGGLQGEPKKTGEDKRRGKKKRGGGRLNH